MGVEAVICPWEEVPQDVTSTGSSQVIDNIFIMAPHILYQIQKFLFSVYLLSCQTISKLTLCNSKLTSKLLIVLSKNTAIFLFYGAR